MGQGMTWLQWVQLVEIPMIVLAVGLAVKLNAARTSEIATLRQQLNDFKLEAAKTYATNTFIVEVRDELRSDFEKIEKKIDRLVELTMNDRRTGRQ